MNELSKMDVYACALSMPTPGKPMCIEWAEEIKRHVERSKRDQIYLVGHSLGVPAILRYLESENAKKIQGAVFVSSPVFKTKKRKVANFLKEPFDFTAIKRHCAKFSVIHGDNNRSVSVEQGEFLANALGVELVLIKNGGHLNGSSGWNSLPRALNALVEMF